MSIITKEQALQVANFLDNKAGRASIDWLMKKVKVNKLNDLDDKLSAMGLTSPDYAREVLLGVGLDFKVGGAENLQAIQDGPFITIHNHPYGGVDGIFLADFFGHLRSDYKIMVNKFLSLVKGLNESFITVQPVYEGVHGVHSESIRGIKAAMEHLRDGHPLGLFPSGAVSDLAPKEGFIIRDREWQESVIKLIKKVKIPVVPVRFFDHNSSRFYSLGLIDWKLRAITLPSEILNKKGETHRVGIGKVITPEEIASFQDLDSLRKFLRSSVYGMAEPAEYKPYRDICH